jgi:hypothetical protein
MEYPRKIRRAPAKTIILGLEVLSQIFPTNGAIMAYVPPLMMNIVPFATGLRSNCWKDNCIPLASCTFAI